MPSRNESDVKESVVPVIVSVIGYLLLVIALVCLLMRHSLLGSGTVPIVIQSLAVLLMIWARITFRGRSFHVSAAPTDGGLVTSGPYKFIRHPIYASILFFIWAGVLSHISVIDILLGVLGTGGAFIRIILEERLLRLRYPEYTEYSAKTKRIVPFVY